MAEKYTLRSKWASPRSRGGETPPKCLGWGKYQVEELPELAQEVEAFLDRYHYHRPHLYGNIAAGTLARKPMGRNILV